MAVTAACRHIAVIPCRWGASRFPGKPLALLGDMPLLWHVHQRCQEAKRIDDAVVATDDERIEAACRRLGIPCVMTGDHPTGTDRVAECAQRVQADAYINVQGDEPFIAPAAIDAVSEALIHLSAETLAVNAYAKLDDAASVIDHNVVKVVVGENGNAQRAEGDEMLRLVEHGHGVRMLPVEDEGIAVDTPEDLERACAMLRSHS